MDRDLVAVLPCQAFRNDGNQVGARHDIRNGEKIRNSERRAPIESLNFASAIPQAEILIQLISTSTGITYTKIMYPGAVPVVAALLRGEVHMNLNSIGPFIPHLEAGAVRPLFITGSQRMAQYPDLPTAGEVGVPNFEHGSSNTGYWAPPGTPRAIIDKLNRSAVAAVKMPDIVDMYKMLGFVTVASTPEEQLRTYETAAKFWTETARKVNYEPK